MEACSLHRMQMCIASFFMIGGRKNVTYGTTTSQWTILCRSQFGGWIGNLNRVADCVRMRAKLVTDHSWRFVREK